MTEHFDPRRFVAECPGVSGAGAQGGYRGGEPDHDMVIRDAFDIADGLFREAAEDFARLRKQLRGVAGAGGKDRKGAGPSVGDGLKEAVKLARELRAATQLMLEERNRVDRLRKEIAGGVDGGGALDLDAARDEIGRRLACLRRAAGG